jgi:uncharacterized protein (TIGR03437 family)
MNKSAARLLVALLLLAAAPAGQSQTTGPTVSPSSLTFSYQVNSTTLPGAGKLTVTLPASLSTAVILAKPKNAAWLAVTPDQGRSPLALTVTANPTGLPPGNYAGTIDVSTTPASTTVSVAVSLSISNPPSTITVTSADPLFYTAPTAGSAAILSFTYTTGTTDPATGLADPTPHSIELDVTSTGDVIPFNVTASAASSKGGTGTGSSAVWARVNQTGQLPNLTTSGVALSGSSVPIFVTVDGVALATLDPGSYTGLVTIAATSSVNGSVPVNVSLVVSAGPAGLAPPAGSPSGTPNSITIFPASLVANPILDPLITIYGDNFFSTSAVTLQTHNKCAQPITLPAKLLSRKVMQATIKTGYLTPPACAPAGYPVQWDISVMNPAPPNNPAPAPVTAVLDVTDPTLPTITSVANAASFQITAVQSGTGANPVPSGGTSISPREIISIFGQNLGPSVATPQSAAGSSPATYPTSSATGVQVMFNVGSGGTSYLAPLLMVSSNQINCIVPKEIVAGTSPVTIAVTNGTSWTVPYPAAGPGLTVVAEDPGIFTFGGLGQGQGALLNFDASTGSYIINSSKNAAARGSTVAIYATGLGDLDPSVSIGNGDVATAAVTLADNTCRVDIDGQPAVVSYAGTSPKAVAGLVQINAIVPPTVKTGAAIPITVSIGSSTTARRSQPGVTLAVK